jgi:hypothetical protein
MTEEMRALALPKPEDMFLAPVADYQTIMLSYQLKHDFIEKALRKDLDFGTIPGSAKPALYKPGAEKLANLYGFAPVFEDVETIEDWTGKDHGGEIFIYYRQKCKLYRGNRMVGSADGSCNSWETKYRSRWVSEADVPPHLDKSRLKTRGGRISEFGFAIDKAETTGQYGKPAEYWARFQDAITNGTAAKVTKKTKSGKLMDAWEIDALQYRIPNEDVCDAANTILKMAQKRALVAAILITTGASDYFTQDIDDFIEGEYTVLPPADNSKATGNPATGEPEFPPLDLGTQPAGSDKPAPAPSTTKAEQPTQPPANDWDPAVIEEIAKTMKITPAKVRTTIGFSNEFPHCANKREASPYLKVWFDYYAKARAAKMTPQEAGAQADVETFKVAETIPPDAI